MVECVDVSVKETLPKKSSFEIMKNVHKVREWLSVDLDRIFGSKTK